jgi:hypothetical protein
MVAGTLETLIGQLAVTGMRIGEAIGLDRGDVDLTAGRIFALVAQRALEPDSKLAATGWVNQRVVIEGCASFTDDQAYRAMDFLLDALEEFADEVFASVAHLLSLDLDIVFVDTTSTYWEVEVPDDLADLAREEGRRRRGEPSGPGPGSGRSVTPTCAGWCGSPTAGSPWPPTGLPDPRWRALHPRREAAPHQHRGRRRAGPGRPLPHRGQEPAGQGSPRRPRGDGDGDDGMRAQRFVICRNREQGERDAVVRDHLVAHLTGLIAGSDGWTPRRRDELVGSLRGKPGLRRYLRRNGSGLLRIDAAAIKRESHLDGKWLLRTSDTTLTPDDLAAPRPVSRRSTATSSRSPEFLTSRNGRSAGPHPP